MTCYKGWHHKSTLILWRCGNWSFFKHGDYTIISSI